MIKTYTIALFLFFSAFAIAQQGSSSAYSFYGIGDVRFKGNVENRLMGGISVFPDTIHINIQNPATYSAIKLSTFTVGANTNYNRLSSDAGDEKAQRTSVGYMAVAIPMKKMGFGFGLIPYSSVGYRIRNESTTTIDNEAASIVRRYEGNGGVNKVFLGFGYKFNSNFSIGADVNYNFGKIDTKNIEKISAIEFGTQELNTSNLSGFNFNVSLNYKHKLNENLDAYGSVIFSPESKLESANTRIISTVIYSDFFDPQDVQRLDEVDSTIDIRLPSKLTLGFGIGQNRKWMIGSEVTFQKSSRFGNRTDDFANVIYRDAVSYHLGGYFIPNYSTFSNYFKKITYRGGLRYEKTGMNINNQDIKDYAVTAGFGLPLGGAFSNLNVGVEFGKRGTITASLIEENYTNLLLSLSLNDRWFIKRKYD